MSLSSRLRSLFLATSAPRVLLETLLLAPLLWLFLLWLDLASPSLSLNFFSGGTVFLVPACALYAALRLRYPGGNELAVALALSVGFVVTLGAFAGWLSLGTVQAALSSYIIAGLNWLLIVGVLSGPLFLAFRFGVRLWLFWDRLRRKHLVWALTHAHLVLVVVVSLLFALFITLASGYRSGVYNTGAGLSDALVDIFAHLVAQILPILGLLIVATLAVLAIVLPPSILFSFLVSRRTTRRLADLALAAEALRGGEYGVRVKVDGEDEVATLQEGFNAMASELQSAMRELRAERDTVAALSQSRRELVAGVSHDLRTPVAMIRGYIESSLNNRAGVVPTGVRHDLEVMEREVIRLQSLIDDLFTVARAESGGLSLRLVPTDVGKLARRIAETAAPLVWQSSKVQVIADVAADLPPACADAARLEQVLGNLLHNAVRHTPAGGLVGILATAEADTVVLRVQDTGSGIAPEDLPRIWQRFYRAGGAGNPDEGAGLGLTLVKELTEAMGGTVSVASTPGEGSVFTVRLKHGAN